MAETHSRTFLKLIKEGKRLHDILQYGSELIHNPILILDDHYSPWDFTTDYPEEDIKKWYKYTEEAGKKIEDYFNKIADEVPFIAEESVIGRRHLICKSIWNDRIVGTLVLPEIDIPLDKIDQEILNLLADACSISGIFEPEKKLAENKKPLVYLLNDLLEDRVRSASEFEMRLEGCIEERYFPYRIIHVYSPDYEKDILFQSSILARLHEREDISWIIMTEKRLLLICKGEQITDSLTEYLLEMNNQYGFIYGISDVANDLWNLKWMAHEAQTTTRFAMYALRHTAIHYFDDYKFYAVADKVEEEHWESYLSNGFKQMLEYDERNGTEYLRTLQSYMSNDAHVQKTSEELFLHKNTLFYRLKRIKELFGIDMEANKDLLKLYFSFALYKLNKYQPKQTETLASTSKIKL